MEALDLVLTAPVPEMGNRTCGSVIRDADPLSGAALRWQVEAAEGQSAPEAGRRFIVTATLGEPGSAGAPLYQAA